MVIQRQHICPVIKSSWVRIPLDPRWFEVGNTYRGDTLVIDTFKTKHDKKWIKSKNWGEFKRERESKYFQQKLIIQFICFGFSKKRERERGPDQTGP